MLDGKESSLFDQVFGSSRSPSMVLVNSLTSCVTNLSTECYCGRALSKKIIVAKMERVSEVLQLTVVIERGRSSCVESQGS